MKRLGLSLIAVALAAGTALAGRPITTYVPMPPVPGTEAVSSNVIFLNRCASNCTVHQSGTDDSRTDSSTIGGGVLQAFNCGDAVWTQVVQCMNDVFSPFNVKITDQDPGSASHLEIMIAGSPQNIGLGPNVGGIAPFRCQQYQSNALVFDFANVWQCNVEDICSTAAQEIAHTWSLDHSTDKTDPMTYYPYNMRRYYDNTSQQCGSDCVQGQSPFGFQCTGTTSQDHPCSCTNQNTQNSYAEILALFGAGTPVPPTVAITKPENGAIVQPGFPVVSTVSSPYGNPSKAELRIDGQLVMTVTSQPFVFNSPSTLGTGNHTVEVTGYDNHGVSAKTSITVAIGPPCQKPSDCPVNTDTCIGGQCVPGPGMQGGLGSTCTDPTQCASGNCASDGTNQYCVETCMKGQCPSGFGCEPVNGDMGYCWPGYNDGSGGGGCDAGAGGPALFGLTALVGLLALRRRRA